MVHRPLEKVDLIWMMRRRLFFFAVPRTYSILKLSLMAAVTAEEVVLRSYQASSAVVGSAALPW